MVRLIAALRTAALCASSLACASCATTPPPVPASFAAAAAGDDDVGALKERVGRLERRLADVDAKLGLLLAQRAAPRRPASITQGSIDQLGPRDLIVDEPRPGAFAEEASLGARAIDLPRRRQPVEEEPVAEAGGEDDGSAPVLIQLHGSPGAPDAAAPPAGPPAGASPDESYAWAQARLREGRHLEAIASLEDIVQRNPNHDLADNSVYWIGWAHAQRGDNKLAVDVWQRLPLRFPHSPKVPDALFGMAVAHEGMGEPAVAETLYEQLVSQYPRAEKVRDAKKALARLRPR